jgi:hypothetical protein
MDDPRLPGVGSLLGDAAREVLVPAVGAAGGRLRTVHVTQVRYTPGGRVLVRYAAEVEWADGSRRTETFGALLQSRAVRAPDAGEAADDELPSGLSVVERADGVRVGVWRYPHDPFLPGLPHAAYPEGVRQILERLGVGPQGRAGAGDIRLEPLVYRPGSRAVIRVRAGGAALYLKVLRPGAATRLRELHDAFGPHVPVPRCLGWSDELGIVALEALGGATMTRPLVDGGALPPPSALLGMLRRLAHAEVPSSPAPARGGIHGHASLLSTALPAAAGEVEDILAAAADVGTGPPRTVHGDFYSAQVLVRDGVISGLLDIDGARPGGPLDDIANLCGHLVALAHVHPGSAGRIDTYRAEVTEALGAVDHPALQRMTLGVLLGLATTPFRRQEPQWEERTMAWLAACRAFMRRGDVAGCG